jgi:hypothetical protein
METVFYTEEKDRVAVSEWDETKVWLSLMMGRCTAGVVLTREEAAQLVVGLQEILAKEAA